MLIKLIFSSFRFCMSIGFGGGGGGGGDSGGNDELWNAQAEQVRQNTAMSGTMFDYWQKYAPQYIDRAGDMASEAFTGVLDAKMRSDAEQEAIAANAKSTAAMNQNLATYGVNPNSGAFADMNLKQAVAGASNITNAKNKAGEWAENQKWARNQDAYGLTSGMPGSAVAAANSAQYGLNGMASMQNSQNAMDSRNAYGYGTMGGMMASAMFKKDGGIVKYYANGGAVRPQHSRVARLAMGGVVGRLADNGPGTATLRYLGDDAAKDPNTAQQLASIAGDVIGAKIFRDGGAVRLAAGGLPRNPVQGWRERMASMPTIARTDDGGSPIANVVSGAMPTVATELAKPYLKQAGSAVKDAIARGIGEARNGLERAVGVDQTQAPADVIDKTTDAGGKMMGDAPMAGGETGATAATDTAATTATEAGASAASDAAATAASDAAATAAAETAATAAAEAGTTAAVEGVAAANSWNPVGWVLGALALANAASKADGGEVNYVDMTPGGPVRGPGTETSDSIPAMLSDGEYVLNAGAVKMIGKRKLDDVNKKGLKFRDDHLAKSNMVLRLAGGGLANLGIALGAGVDEYRRGQEQDRRDEELAMRKQEAERQALRFSWEQLDAKEKERVRSEGNAILAKYKPRFEALNSGDYSSFLPDALKDYNANTGGLNDGHTATLQSTPKGTVINFMNKDGQVVHSQPINPQFVKQATTAAMLSELAAISPESALRGAKLDLENRQVGAAEQIAASHILATKNMGEHLVRSDANAAKNTENQFILGKGNLAVAQGNLGIHQQNANLANERWGIEKQELEARVGDSAVQRAARKGLIEAIASGDDKAVEKAKQVAIAAGVKLDKPQMEYTTVIDQMGNRAIITDKDRGSARVIDLQSGATKNLSAPGQPANVAFANVAEAKRALKDGKIKAGDTVMIGGRPARVN